ncbi:MAG: hypothetical protein IGS50_18270 [Synechococcales cyanobacterium C42_A2020_086]|nr:hypothetical protein [Synechococcales cyanobacterium C42_A2020_086]
MPSTVRVPDDLYETLREIRLPLEQQYQSAAPTIQDMVNVALKRFIKDWSDAEERPSLLDELLEQRKLARARMGQKFKDLGEEQRV